MSGFRQKLQLLYPRFLLVSIGYIPVYTFLHWLIKVHYGFFLMDETVLNFFVPFLLLWAPLLAGLWPRIRLLKPIAARTRRAALLWLAWLAICVPVGFAQEYMIRLTGKLTAVDSPVDILHRPFTKYYTIRSYYIDKSKTKFYRNTSLSGKGGTLNFYLYAMCAMKNSNMDTIKIVRKVWLGNYWTESVSNSWPKWKKDSVYKSFIIRRLADFDTMNLLSYQYFDRLGNDLRRSEYVTTFERNTYSMNGKNFVILEGHTSSFENRTGHMLGATLLSFAIAALVWPLFLFYYTIDPDALEKMQSGR